ncbi:unnamed protein product, partial [Staurois parvus]
GVSPAACFTGHPVFQEVGVFSVGTRLCSLRFHSRVPTDRAQVALRFMNGPVVFWDLSRVPKDYREGGHLPIGPPEVGAGTCQIRVPAPPRPPKVPILNGEQGTSL